MIKLKNITKKYGNYLALDKVSFSIKKGKVTALLGPNGAGKTTSMKILTGFLEPTNGVVEIDNQILIAKNKSIIQKKIGYLPENAPLYPELNVWEHLDFSVKIHGLSKHERVKAIQKSAQLCGLNDKLYFDISELSKGYKQRVGLAQAIIHDPEILILDEPTTGLDPNQILEIRDLILSWRLEKTILLSTHIMQEVEALADDVIVLNQGRVVKETSKSKLNIHKNEHQQEVLKIKVTIDGKSKELKKAQKHLSSIEELVIIKNDGNTFMIESPKDCRSMIARKLIEADLDLLELMLHETSMEDVFINLTKN